MYQQGDNSEFHGYMYIVMHHLATIFLIWSFIQRINWMHNLIVRNFTLPFSFTNEDHDERGPIKKSCTPQFEWILNQTQLCVNVHYLHFLVYLSFKITKNRFCNGYYISSMIYFIFNCTIAENYIKISNEEWFFWIL